MKKIFSLIIILVLLVSCSSLQNKAEQAYMEYRKAWQENKISESVDFWHPAIVKNQKDDIITKQQYIRNELGNLAKTESVKILSSKIMPTFVFSGIIFNEVVQMDIVIRINKIENMTERHKQMFKDMDSLVIRELVFMCEYEGKMKIIQSQERQ